MRLPHEKKTEKCPQFSQNENIVVKIGLEFANFDKNILILRKFEKFFCLFLFFSHDFCQCAADLGRGEEK